MKTVCIIIIYGLFSRSESVMFTFSLFYVFVLLFIKLLP